MEHMPLHPPTGLVLSREIKMGLAAAAPIILGYLPIGFAFGVLAGDAGMTVAGATAMSLFVYAGSAQLISIGLLAGEAGLLSLTFTIFLVNLRHLLMSASLAPFLGRLGRLQQALFSFQLTDESFAVHSACFKNAGVPPAARLFTVNVSAQLAWVSSTFLGAWTGGMLDLDTAVMGLDYALPAMFIALLILQLDDRRRVAVAFLAGALSTAFYLAGTGHWHIILAAVLAAAAGAFLHDRAAPPGERGRG